MVYCCQGPVDDDKVWALTYCQQGRKPDIPGTSYLWVLETNTGATWRTGYLRIVSKSFVSWHETQPGPRSQLGTIFGATYAYVVGSILFMHLNSAHCILQTWLICKRNPYGLVVLVTVCANSKLRCTKPD